MCPPQSRGVLHKAARPSQWVSICDAHIYQLLQSRSLYFPRPLAGIGGAVGSQGLKIMEKVDEKLRKRGLVIALTKCSTGIPIETRVSGRLSIRRAAFRSLSQQ